MIEVINLLITIFLLVAIGVLSKKLHLISKQGQKNINDLVIYIILPCNIMKAFMQNQGGKITKSYMIVFFIAALIQMLSIFYGKVLYRNEPQGKRKCLQYATICSNSGFLGNPIAEGLYGAEGLLLASIYLIPLRVMMWSFGLPVFSGENEWKKTTKKVVTHPCILACVLGIVIMLTRIQIPAAISGTISSLGNCNTALSMMVVGMILADIEFKKIWDWKVFWYSIHRLIIIPLIVYVVLRLSHVDGINLGICVILTAMPAGATTSILAEKYNMEPEFSTKLVVLSTLFSLPTIALWSLILI